jgi:uncharacterized protein YyaL (SSP411 family)
MPEEPSKHTNRLISEKSPYLLQHAYNPVDWYPWGSEAFEKARKENKPIFLSIGYSTCHWCHVMERESFEDFEVAGLMNEVFISIKVDREERPDIDNIYMTVCQMVSGRGGWPLTIIMTPDKKPFFAGTYLPKESRRGQVGMLDLIPRIKKLWETQQDEILDSANKSAAVLKKLTNDSSGQELNESILHVAYEQLAERFDEHYGGFQSAPKFPTPHNLLFLLRYWKRTGNGKALEMVEKTLQAMRRGGIYDHIGFGFHRYSTDAKWLVPHFEKMIYDQALLAMAYIEVYQATGSDEYKNTAEEIFTYVLREMTSPEGGFSSAEDADSEGEEGKFYLWSEEEVQTILGREQADLLSKVFNLEEGGNFAEEASGQRTSRNILYLKESIGDIADDLKISEQDLTRRLESARQKLFTVREYRNRPLKDDKILTDWNGLMIAALAKATQAFAEPRYASAAKNAVDFILRDMRTADGRLLHRYRNGQAALPAYVDDYAFLIWGLLELYEATFEVHYLKAALELNNDLIKYFWDEQKGGFYFTADDSEELLARPKEIYDGALPSGNSVAMLNLFRLGRITGNSDLAKKAVQIGCAFSQSIRQFPSAYTQLMVALDFGVKPAYEIVIAGNSQANDTKSMLKALRAEFVPNKIVLFRPNEQELPDIVSLADFTRNQLSIDGKATAYVCLDYACQRPTTEVTKMLELLRVQEQPQNR